MLPAIDDRRVLVDASANDDAAVYRIAEDRALVATVDFFTPIVDDAYTFGAIAAANAFSDVYAMGGRPLFALNLVAWPRTDEMLDVLAYVVTGGADKAREAGAFILGGHSIDDEEPKFGMVVVGEIDPRDALTCGNLREGDSIVLTKPIGTGILATALKRGAVTEEDIDDAIGSMTTLNAGALDAIERAGGVHAATDVTGFGLLGHLDNLIGESGFGVRLSSSAVPLFERTKEMAESGAVPGGTSRNVDAASSYVDWGDVPELTRTLLCDAQTSGGLLIAVAADHRDTLLQELRRTGFGASAAVGEVVAGTEARIEVKTA